MQQFLRHTPKRIFEDLIDSSLIEPYLIRFYFSVLKHHSIGVFMVQSIVKLFHNL